MSIYTTRGYVLRLIAAALVGTGVGLLIAWVTK